MMNKLIITADDFGMCEEVNDAILECISAGNIRSTNVMANMDHAYDTRLLENRDNVTIGLHWNLTTGRPVLRPELIPSLVGADGNFLDSGAFRAAIKKGFIRRHEIRNELKAQYEKFISFYGKPDYWNSHENIHTNVRLFRFFVDFAVDLVILGMRCHNKIYIGSDESTVYRDGLKDFLKKYIFRHWYGKALKKGMHMPLGTICFVNPEGRYSISEDSKDFSWALDEIAEMHVHPSKGADNIFFGAVTKDRVRDYELFSNPRLLHILNENQVEIVDYRQLNG
jgi:hypothetical protein